MAITTFATNTTTLTGSSTEDFLSSPNEAGEFRLVIDLNAMAANDIIQATGYQMAITGGTSRKAWMVQFAGAQAAHELVRYSEWMSNALTDTNALRFSLTQTFGTGRAIPWSVQKRDDALKPTVAGRTLDVTATGAAGIDWANVENPTTALNLSATNIDVDQVVASVSGAVGSVTGAVGSVTGAVGSVTGNVGGNVTGTVASVVGNVGGNVTGTVASVVGNVGGNVVGSVASVTAGVTLAAGAVTAAAIATGAIDADAIAADAVTEIQSGLATAAALTVVDDFLDTEIAAIIALLGTPAGASLAADIAAIEAQTDDIGVAGAGLTAVPWSVANLASLFTTNSGQTSGTAIDGSPVKEIADLVAAGAASIQALVDGVLNEAIASHLNVGSVGEAINDAAAGGGLDAAGVRAAIGMASANLDTQLGDVPTVAEFNARTLVAASYATAAAITALNNLSAAQVNTEVLDVLNVDTFAELAAVPAASATLTQMLRWLYILSRNLHTQSSTTHLIKADNGSTTVGTSTVSDSGSLLTVGEWA